MGDLLLGGLIGHRLPLVVRPVALLEQLTNALERRLNRSFRSAATRLIRGLILLLMLALPVAVAAKLIEEAADTVPFIWILELVFVAALTSPRMPFDDMRAATRAIAGGNLAVARVADTPLIGAGAARMDRLELSAALICRLGERINTNFVAAAFWFALLGIAGLAVYRAAHVVAQRLSEDDELDVIFGFSAIRFHEAIAIIPAFISGMLIVPASAFVPQARAGRAFASAVTWPVDRPASRQWPGTVLAKALAVEASGAVNAAQSGTLLNRAAYLYALSVGFGFALLALAALLRLAM
ncbi:MAG: cobalamin biosynthesis protein [Proteobacteria bacterium]|nr:cobalamin biosynthesis protein [Pseudomonadota bacterium]